MSTATKTKPANPNVNANGEPIVRLRYLPVKCLDEYIATIAGRDFRDFDNIADTEYARLCGVSPKSVERWHNNGRLSWTKADSVATFLGQHPIKIWGALWLNLDDPYEPGYVGDAIQLGV